MHASSDMWQMARTETLLSTNGNLQMIRFNNNAELFPQLYTTQRDFPYPLSPPLNLREFPTPVILDQARGG